MLIDRILLISSLAAISRNVSRSRHGALCVSLLYVYELFG